MNADKKSGERNGNGKGTILNTKDTKGNTRDTKFFLI
jgi:hypothetical protein